MNNGQKGFHLVPSKDVHVGDVIKANIVIDVLDLVPGAGPTTGRLVRCVLYGDLYFT